MDKQPPKPTSYAVWNPLGDLALLSGLGQPTSISLAAATGPWQKVVIYVSDEGIDQWMDGRRQNLFLTKRAPGDKLSLIVNGFYHMDDLTVRSVRPDEVPDISPYIGAIEAIPEEKRVGIVQLPQFKPGKTHSQVFVEFVKRTP